MMVRGKGTDKGCVREPAREAAPTKEMFINHQ